jgi:GST-like protein
MSYVLYGSRGSGSLAVELALSEAGIPCRVEDTSIKDEAQRSEWFSAINPQRKVPALLTPQSETLTESAAILLTLDERHREAALLPPPGSPERAQALRWLLFISSEIYPLIEVIDFPERFEASPGTADAMRALAKAKWRERWLLVEGAVAGAPWLLPSGFCLVDLYIAVISRWPSGDKEYRNEWLPTRAPRVEALARAVAERPACKTVWQSHFPSPLAPTPLYE